MTLALAALPEFVVGIALVVLFATTVFHVAAGGDAASRPGAKPWDDLEGHDPADR